MISAFITGYIDGFNEPYEIGSGMTYENSNTRQFAWDWGANIGQCCGRIFNRYQNRNIEPR